MIELNLLPDVKLDYIKAQRSRRLVFTVSILAAVVSVALLVLLFSVGLLQKKHLSDLTNDITTESKTLQDKPEIDKILTVQNQLESLTALHAGKPTAARLFGYMNSVTPSKVAINNLHVDFTAQTATITGTSDALASVNKYIDTLKFTKYTTGGAAAEAKAFSNVVLTSFGVSSEAESKAQAANYTISLNYDKNIFDITQTIKLSVPKLTTTRAALNQPVDLFQAAPKASKESQ
jgi:hypothetical protein